MNIKYGMILAAGLGKRMQPLTLKIPNPLLEINNYTLLERAINLLIMRWKLMVMPYLMVKKCMWLG